DLPDRGLDLFARLEQEVARLLTRAPLRVLLALADLVLALLHAAAQVERFGARGLGRGERFRHRALLFLQLEEQLPDLAFALRHERLSQREQVIREPEPPCDGQTVAPARHALDQAVGRAQLPRVELERRV